MQLGLARQECALRAQTCQILQGLPVGTVTRELRLFPPEGPAVPIYQSRLGLQSWAALTTTMLT